MSYILSLDIGGTKIATIITDLKGDIISRVELKSNSIDREKMFAQVLKSIRMVQKESGIPFEKIVGTGLGVPGKIDREKGIAVFQNNLPWENFPIVERLKNELPLENIVLDNDVYMATFAEWKATGANPQDTFVYITISTGISCSIIHQGSFIRGNGFAGEIGLLPVYHNPLSEENSIITLEHSASGSAMERLAQQKFNQPDLKNEDLFTKYQNGDQSAQDLMNEIVGSLAYGVYSIICLLDPNQIIFGGGVINNQPILLDLIKSKLENYLTTEQQSILERMQTSHFKGDAGVMGAAYRAMMNLEKMEII